jgi:hypothetical protein
MELESKEPQDRHLGERNWSRWSTAMKRFLEAQELWYVISEDVRPAEDALEVKKQEAINTKEEAKALQQAGEKVDIQRMLKGKSDKPLVNKDKMILMAWQLKQDGRKVISHIISQCDAVNTARIKDITIPSYAWNALADHHKDQSAQNVTNITDKIRACLEEECKTMSEYLNTQRAHWDALLDAGGGLEERAFCGMVLTNLGHKYDVQAGILNTDPNLKIKRMEQTLISAAMMYQSRSTRKSNKKPHANKTESSIEAIVSRAVAKVLKQSGRNAKNHQQNKNQGEKGSGPGICYRFADTGSCKFGSHCRFRHVGAEKKSKTAAEGSSASDSPDSDNE